MSQRVAEILAHVRVATSGARPGPAAAHPEPAPAPGDSLHVSGAGGPLQKLLGGQEPTPGEWQALAREVADMPAWGRGPLAQRLAGKGWVLSVADQGRLVSFAGRDAIVTVAPAHGLMRRIAGRASELWLGEHVVARYADSGDHIAISRGAHREVWHKGTASATLDGRALGPSGVFTLAGEAPRMPWRSVPPGQFRLPPWRGQADAAYVREVEQALVAAGGRVVRPADAGTPEGDWTNCFSWALTGGSGDLSDPFAHPTMPRWLHSPAFQLVHRGWGRLQPTQRAREGDLLLYRDEHGQPAHMGVVRAVDTDGNPALIESKWGAWGVYLHRPFDVRDGFGRPAELYRRVAA